MIYDIVFRFTSLENDSESNQICKIQIYFDSYKYYKNGSLWDIMFGNDNKIVTFTSV